MLSPTVPVPHRYRIMRTCIRALIIIAISVLEIFILRIIFFLIS